MGGRVLNRSRVRFFFYPFSIIPSIISLMVGDSSPLVYLSIKKRCAFRSPREAAVSAAKIGRSDSEIRFSEIRFSFSSKSDLSELCLSNRLTPGLLIGIPINSLVGEGFLVPTHDGGGRERRRRHAHASTTAPPIPGCRCPLHAHAQHARGEAWMAHFSSP